LMCARRARFWRAEWAACFGLRDIGVTSVHTPWLSPRRCGGASALWWGTDPAAAFWVDALQFHRAALAGGLPDGAGAGLVERVGITLGRSLLRCGAADGDEHPAG